MNVYALSYRNPHEPTTPFVIFIASERLIELEEARASAIEAVQADGLGNEWLDAIADGLLCGPLELDGSLRQPSIAVVIS